jgi:hypothetical protein
LVWVINHREKDIVMVLNIQDLPNKEKLRLINLIIPASKLEYYMSNYTMSTHFVLSIADTNLVITITIGHYFKRITGVEIVER